MAQPSLFPLFMLNPFAAGTGGGGDGLIVELVAEPDIVISEDISLTVEPDELDVTIEEDTEIEVDC